MTPKETKVALIQMRCGAEPEKNFARAIEFIRDAAMQGAKIVCLPELFRSQYFCQSEEHKNFELAEEVPGTSTSALEKIACELGDRDRCIAVRKARCRSLPQHSRDHRRRWETSSASIARCISRTIRFTTRNFISRPATSGFASWKTQQGKIGVCVCWDQWYPEAARLTALSGAEIIFYPRLSAGIHRRKTSSAKRNIPPGKRSSAVTPSRMVVMLQRRTGSVTKHRLAAKGSSFGAKVLYAARMAKSSPKAPWIEKKSSIADIDWKRVNEHRTHWPFLRDRRVDAYAGIEQRLID